MANKKKTLIDKYWINQTVTCKVERDDKSIIATFYECGKYSGNITINGNEVSIE